MQDEGPGIAPEHQAKVFERFFRITEAKTSTVPGVGLGLYISAQIIRRHGGTIHVESQVGKGATFYFLLPLNPVL